MGGECSNNYRTSAHLVSLAIGPRTPPFGTALLALCTAFHYSQTRYRTLIAPDSAAFPSATVPVYRGIVFTQHVHSQCAMATDDVQGTPRGRSRPRSADNTQQRSLERHRLAAGMPRARLDPRSASAEDFDPYDDDDQPRRRRASPKTRLIIGLSIAAVAVWFAMWAMYPKPPTEAAGDERLPADGAHMAKNNPRDRLADEACTPDEELRTMGTQWLPPERYLGGTPMSVRNMTSSIAFLDMLDPASKERSTTLVVMPGETIAFPLVGHTTLGSVSAGSAWCNRRVGWEDARVTALRDPIVATHDTISVKAVIYERGSTQLGMRVFKERPGVPTPAQFQ